jgi:hypothetical protein
MKQFLALKPYLPWILPDPDPNLTRDRVKKFQVLEDPSPDPQHWSIWQIQQLLNF